MSTIVHREVFSQISGHRALDLVNTVDWRLSRERLTEELHDYDDVLRWATQVGILTNENLDALRVLAERSPAEADNEVVRVRALREALYATLFGDGDPGILASEYSSAIERGALARIDTGWGWQVPVDLSMPRHLIGFEAHDLITRSNLSVLAQCQDAECGWVFLDQSPRHNRRWCVAADCGNRNRAREFYRRSRED